MSRFVIRVWLPDRPGALGRVASAIGSVGASMIGIDILEQDGGWAIDELVIDAVESTNAVDKLVTALHFVEDVSVEDIREASSIAIDPRVDALEAASELVEQKAQAGVREILVQRASHAMDASWGVFVGHNDDAPLVVAGVVPPIAWIKAFVAGSKSSRDIGAVDYGPDDIAWTELIHAEAALVLGRDGRPFRARERQLLIALARIADHRLRELLT
jgi:hypothetical protein